MSTHFPSVNAKQVIQVLHSLGFMERRITGSHHIYRNPQTGRIAVVPRHSNRDIKKGTLRNIVAQMGLSLAEFFEYLKSQ